MEVDHVEQLLKGKHAFNFNHVVDVLVWDVGLETFNELADHKPLVMQLGRLDSYFLLVF